jgi:hypothetical protein
MTIRIMRGGYNMPPLAGILKPTELDHPVSFLRSRREGSPMSTTASPRPGRRYAYLPVPSSSSWSLR